MSWGDVVQGSFCNRYVKPEKQWQFQLITCCKYNKLIRGIFRKRINLSLKILITFINIMNNIRMKNVIPVATWTQKN